MLEEALSNESRLSAPALARELQNVRHQSLIAARGGHFRKVAALSVRATRLHEQLKHTQAEEHSNAAPRG